MKWQQRRTHAYIWYVLAVLIPLIIVFGIFIKQDFAEEAEPVPLNAVAEKYHEGNNNEENNN